MAKIETELDYSKPRSRPLRLGLLVDSMTQPAWILRALQRIIETGVGEFVIVIRNAAPSASVKRSRLAGYWRNRRHLLYAAYQRLDASSAPNPDPFAPVDISSLLAGVSHLDVVPEQTKASDVIRAEDIDRIRAAGPDVLIRLGFRILRGDILQAAPLGVWSYHHGDNARYRGGPPCFWEVFEGEPVTGTVLQRLTEALDDGEVLYRSWGATNKLSVGKSRAEIYWKSSEFLARALGDFQYREGNAPPQPVAVPYGQKLYVTPTNLEMVAGFSKLVTRRARAKLASLTLADQWFLAYRHRASVPDENREPELSPFRFKTIMPPRDRFWADPFPVRVGGAHYLLFEEYQYATRRGVISAIELGPDGPVGSSHEVLSRDYHLSYPFVFSWRGSTFLMPESADVQRVEVYRATKPPYEWTLEAVVMDGMPMADCTVAEIGGRWWMFANSAVQGGSFWDELFLFYGPSPLGPWTPHRSNPVVSDVRRARPAGGLFQRRGQWYRPSQDCSESYGGALNINRIVRIDEHQYLEEPAGKLLPNWAPGLTGVHTVNALGGLTTIDVRRRIFRPGGG